MELRRTVLQGACRQSAAFARALAMLPPQRQFSTSPSCSKPPPPSSLGEALAPAPPAPAPAPSPTSAPAPPRGTWSGSTTPSSNPMSRLSPRERLQSATGAVPSRPTFLTNWGTNTKSERPWNAPRQQQGSKPDGSSFDASKFPQPSIMAAGADRAPRTTYSQTLWDQTHIAQLMNQTKQQGQLRLVPSTGRTISLGANADPARGFFLLERAVRKNQVKVDVRLQRFHERPGLKRKRLRSERWRKRFKAGFQATCSRVMELRNQGW